MNEQSIGKYRIEQRLGSGAFATVYRCFDPDLDTVCAIKILAENWSDDERARIWFLNEARVMFGFEHPNVLRVYTSGTLEDGRPYFVMEYANRGSLADLIQQRRKLEEPFSLPESLEISIAVAQGLIAAHRRGLVHRDLKPSNILFREAPDHVSGKGVQRQIKLADFGLSRGLEHGTNSLAGAGTPHYIAPEQARSRADDAPDTRSDVYAAAAILYELIGGEVPFPYRSMSEVINAHLHENPAPLDALAPDAPAELVQLVHHGLQKDPENRVASATLWRDQLQVLRTALLPDGRIAGWSELQPFSPQASGEVDSTTREAPTDDAEDTVVAPIVPIDEIASQASDQEEAKLVNLQDTVISLPPAEYHEHERPDISPPVTTYAMVAVIGGLILVGILGVVLADLVGEGTNGSGDGRDDTVETAGPDDDDDDLTGIALSPTPDPTPTTVVGPEPAPTPAGASGDATPAPTPDLTPTPESVEIESETLAELERLMEDLPDDSHSLILLPDGTEIGVSADSEIAAGSTISLWVAAAAYDRAAAGEIDLEDEHTISAGDQAPGTGILNGADYVAETLTLHELIEIMLLYSDNTATNIVTDMIGGLDAVSEYASEHGYPETRMQRYLGSLDPANENYSSARDGAMFFQRLLEGEIVDETVSSELREVLELRVIADNTGYNYFGRDLDANVRYASVSGLIPGVRNVFGYVWIEQLERPIVISIMLDSLARETAGEDAIATTILEVIRLFEDSE